MDYRVELDVYNGPLDLLLYLLKRDELDIYDIPIARITDSYLNHIHALKSLQSSAGLDINLAGEFLVMAATLMEIKSAMLLPKPPHDPDQTKSATAELTDPRYELVRQLLEYKRFKDAAGALDSQQRLHERRFARYPAEAGEPELDAPPIDLEEVQIYDLLSAFSRLLSEIGTRPKNVHEVTYDDTPIDLHAADIEDRLKRDGALTLRALVVGRSSRSEVIGVFLALLELIRQKKILVRQEQPGDEVNIESAPEEHRRTFQETLGGPPAPSDDPIPQPVPIE